MRKWSALIVAGSAAAALLIGMAPAKEPRSPEAQALDVAIR